MFDWADPNKNGVTDAFDPNKNGVADSFDPSKNGVGDVYSPKIFKAVGSTLEDFGNKVVQGLDDGLGFFAKYLMPDLSKKKGTGSSGTDNSIYLYGLIAVVGVGGYIYYNRKKSI